MSYFKQLRRSTDGNALVRELAEELRRYEAERGISDISLLRQMRVDTDNIAYTDTSANILGGDLDDSDALAITDPIPYNQAIAKGAYVMEDSTSGNLKMFLRPERTGSTADRSGTGLTVTDGSSVVIDAIGVYFPADAIATSHVTVTDNAAIRVAAAFSIGFRMYATDITQEAGSNRRILQKYDDANNEYNVVVGSTGLISFTIKRAGATTSMNTAAGSILTNTPYNILCTSSGATVNIYINGVLANDAAGSLSTDTGTTDLTIGKRGTNANGKYKGYLWDMRFYDTALDATAAANIYNGYSRYGLAGRAALCDTG